MNIFVKLIISGAAAVVGLVGIAIGTDGGNTFSTTAHAQQSAPAAAPMTAPTATPAAAPSTVAAGGVTLHSVSVALPFGDRMFPGGAAAEAINDNCLACHSAGMVLNQPDLTRSTWQQEVEKMRSQYKAPIDERDVSAIVAYLASHKGRE